MNFYRYYKTILCKVDLMSGFIFYAHIYVHIYVCTCAYVLELSILLLNPFLTNSVTSVLSENFHLWFSLSVYY